MKTTANKVLRTLATRSVIAAIPVAMVTAYAGNLFVPVPPRLAEYAVQPVAEIISSPSTVGIAASPLYGQTRAEIDAQLDDMIAIGVTNIRVFVPWALVEYGPDTYNWSLLDNVMASAAARNMGVLAEINATPLWIAQGFPIGASTPPPAQYADFLKAFINHEVGGVTYGSIVSAYEVWNEPNFFQFANPINPEAYAGLLMAASAVIKNATYGDPSATVVAGAVGTGQDDPTGNGLTMNTLTFINRMFAALGPNAGQYFDALSIHPYNQEIPFSGTCPTCAPGMLTPREQFEAIAAMQQLTGKKIWITEYGIPTTPNGPFTEADQAAWDQNLLDTWNAYAKPTSALYDPSIAALLGPIFLYTGRDTPGAQGENNPEDYYGLWDVNGNLKPAGQALKDWLAALNPQEPNPPTNPVNSIGQLLAALVQQITQQFTQFAQFVSAQIGAIVQAIQNLFGSFGSPAAVANAAPLALRVASTLAVEESEAGETPGTEALDADAKTGPKSSVDEIKALDAAGEVVTTPVVEVPGELTTVVATPVVAAPVVATPVVEAPVVTNPVVTQPVVTAPTVNVPVTAPIVTAPVVTAPVVTAPVVTAPVVKAPVVQAPTAPAAGTPSQPTGAEDPSKSGDGGGKSDTKNDGKSETKNVKKPEAKKPVGSRADKPSATDGVSGTSAKTVTSGAPKTVGSATEGAGAGDSEGGGSEG